MKRPTPPKNLGQPRRHGLGPARNRQAEGGHGEPPFEYRRTRGAAAPHAAPTASGFHVASPDDLPMSVASGHAWISLAN
jgi:hypothetical protein